jgi:Cu/Ag efflux protein CusF
MRTIPVLLLGAALSVNAFAATPTPTPSTTPPSSSAQAPVHTIGTVSKIDTTAKSITITGTDGKPMTYSLGTMNLDSSIKVGSKVDIAHAPNSMTATSVTMSK